MTEKSQPIRPHSPSIPQVTEDIPHLSKQMQKHLSLFSEHLQQVLEDPSLRNEEHFQKDFSKNIIHLNRIVEQTLLLR